MTLPVVLYGDYPYTMWNSPRIKTRLPIDGGNTNKQFVCSHPKFAVQPVGRLTVGRLVARTEGSVSTGGQSKSIKSNVVEKNGFCIARKCGGSSLCCSSNNKSSRSSCIANTFSAVETAAATGLLVSAGAEYRSYFNI